MLKYLVIVFGWTTTVMPVNALEKLAVVIGNGSYPAYRLDAPAQNAIMVSQTLLGLGFVVDRLENANAADHPLGRQSADTVLLFFSGLIAVEGGETLLLSVNQESPDKPSGWVLKELVKSYQEAGAKRVLVFLDTCHTGAGEAGHRQARVLDIPNIFQAQAKQCQNETTAGPDFTTTLVEALLASNTTLPDALSDKDNIRFDSSLSSPFSLHAQSRQGKELTEQDREMLDRLSEQDRNKLLDLWRKAGIVKGNPSAPYSPTVISIVKNDTVIFTDPVQPVVISSTLPPATNILAGQTLRQTPGTVRIFTASANPAQQYRPTAAGLPTPSIIVGVIKPEDSFANPTELGAAISGTEMGVLDYNARQKMQTENPELFNRLLTSGAFDPPENALAGAIQTELSRMGCYSSRIDGIWGNGSRAAVDRYFSRIGDTPKTREPVIQLYRQLLRKGDVTCPASRTTARTTPRGTGGSTRTPRTTTRTPPKPATQTGPRTIDRTSNPAGVFR